MSNRLTIAIPIYNQLNDAKGSLGTLRYNTSDDTEFLIIDNGSTDNVENFIWKYLKPKRLHYIRNEENIGMIKTMQQGYEQSSGDVIAFLHNDVFVQDIHKVFVNKHVVYRFEHAANFLGGIPLFTIDSVCQENTRQRNHK